MAGIKHRDRRSLLTAAGLAGFLVLLAASHYLPAFATGLQIAGILWFFVFGLIRFTIDLAQGAPDVRFSSRAPEQEESGAALARRGVDMSDESLVRARLSARQ